MYNAVYYSLSVYSRFAGSWWQGGGACSCCRSPSSSPTSVQSCPELLWSQARTPLVNLQPYTTHTSSLWGSVNACSLTVLPDEMPFESSCQHADFRPILLWEIGITVPVPNPQPFRFLLQAYRLGLPILGLFLEFGPQLLDHRAAQ